MSQKRKGILFSLLAGIFFGGCYIFAKLLLEIVNKETSNVLWFVSSSFIFIIYFALTKNLKKIRIILINWKKILLVSFCSFIGAALWFYGIFYSGIANTSFLVQFSIVFSIILGVVFLKEKFFKTEFLGFLTVIFGVFILTYYGEELSLTGTVIILISSFFVSLSEFFSKIFLKNLDFFSLAAGRSFFILFFVLIYAVLNDKLNLLLPINAYIFSFLGSFLGAFLGFIFFYRALSLMEISKAVIIRTIEPFFILILSFLIFNSRPVFSQFIGGILIIGGIIILTIMAKNNELSQK